MLVDRFNRQVNYIRISVTDRCDFRCRYCMNEHMEFLPREHILSLEEIERLARVFVSLGVTKIRITGGEPLVRKGLIGLLQKLARLEGLQELVLTTNASTLEHYAVPLKQAGVSRINISLDSLQAARFKEITRVGDLDKVLRGIELARKQGFKALKINSVLMQGVNSDEVLDLLHFAMQRNMDISFIEEMPLGQINSHNRALSSVSSDDIQAQIEEKYSLTELIPATTTANNAGPARKFAIAGSQTVLGLISPHSHNFCSSCNRVRLTAEGQLLLCLGNEHSMDFRRLLRHNKLDDAGLALVIREAMDLKPEKHEFNLHEAPQIVRFMNMTGG